MKSRIIWIDFAKVFVMLLVIADHLGFQDERVSSWIWSFHMPAFFFLSGIFSKPEMNIIESIKHDLYRLLLPVLLWHLIGSFIWLPLTAYNMKTGDVWGAYKNLQIDFFTGYGMGFGWFMVCLFWIRIMHKFLHKLKFLGVIVGFTVLPLIAYSVHKFIAIPFYILESLMAFPFYFLAFMLKNFLHRIEKLDTKKIVFGTILFFMSSLILLSFNGNGAINGMRYGNNLLLFYLQGTMGSFFVCFISMMVVNVRNLRMLPYITTLGGGDNCVIALPTTIHSFV